MNSDDSVEGSIMGCEDFFDLPSPSTTLEDLIDKITYGMCNVGIGSVWLIAFGVLIGPTKPFMFYGAILFLVSMFTILILLIVNEAISIHRNERQSEDSLIERMGVRHWIYERLIRQLHDSVEVLGSPHIPEHETRLQLTSPVSGGEERDRRSQAWDTSLQRLLRISDTPPTSGVTTRLRSRQSTNENPDLLMNIIGISQIQGAGGRKRSSGLIVETDGIPDIAPTPDAVVRFRNRSSTGEKDGIIDPPMNVPDTAPTPDAVVRFRNRSSTGEKDDTRDTQMNASD